MTGWLRSLRQLRADAGLPTLRAISESSGVRHTTVSNMLSGQNEPRPENLRRVALALAGENREAAQRVLDEFNMEHDRPRTSIDVAAASTSVLTLSLTRLEADALYGAGRAGQGEYTDTVAHDPDLTPYARAARTLALKRALKKLEQA